MNEAFNTPRSGTRKNEKITFLESHKTEILPLLEEDEREQFLKLLQERNEEERNEFVDSLLERFETKLFTYTPATDAGTGQRVLVTTDAPGSYRATQPILHALAHDERVKGITALVSGIAGKQFHTEFPEFVQKRGEGMVLTDVIEEAKHEPVDVIVSTLTVQNGPESLTTLGGTSHLGAKKNFLMIDGWGVVGTTCAPERISELEKLDGIFCNDEFAKAILATRLPNFPQERIHAVGLPGAEHLEVEKADVYRRETREKLGISKQAYVVLYLGDVSSDYDALDVPHDSNVQTFRKTMDALGQFSDAHPEREIVLIVRPHPRGIGNPDGEELLRPTNVHERIRVVNGMKPLSINEVSYAADTIVSIMSTENLFAPMRGRQSVFLGYEGIGDVVLADTYGAELVSVLDTMEGVTRIQTEQELITVLDKLSSEAPGLSPTRSSEGATARIVNTILA